ncbi:MAG: class I SAM-dependent methyltransferase [Chitinophagaceae bacterium]|jgi:23S rRNA U2552 (ribose-2'-O)-methylase RlmE/FtsJ|nr:class I SAM-dependent methyltransferase [Chitinophagaceae bacterium]
MNDLEKYFEKNEKRLISKWTHYFDIYERHFSRFRNREIVILEIGVFQGGSLQMWKDYFGDKAKIYGVDINPRCKELEEENIKIFIGSQSDRKFLRELKKQIPPIDILIDDGGHTMVQQIVSYEELFDHVKENGVYLCEDVHTSYRVRLGGGHKRRGTFIEYSKNFIDQLNAFHSEQSSLPVSNFTRTADSVHFYDSMVIVEKRNREMPKQVLKGVPSFPENIKKNKGIKKIKGRMQYLFLLRINKVLRFFRLPGFIWR